MSLLRRVCCRVEFMGTSSGSPWLPGRQKSPGSSERLAPHPPITSVPSTCRAEADSLYGCAPSRPTQGWRRWLCIGTGRDAIGTGRWRCEPLQRGVETLALMVIRMLLSKHLTLLMTGNKCTHLLIKLTSYLPGTLAIR